jgi:hypothetical protein
MRIVLHILTRPDDALAQEIITCQQKSKENNIVVEDLTKSHPDYKALMENIFAAESVQVW